MDFIYAAITIAIWGAEGAVAYFVMKQVEDSDDKVSTWLKSLPERLPIVSEVLGGLLAIVIGFGCLALPFFMILALTTNIEQNMQDRQWANCKNATTEDGEYLTRQQCGYFRDVLDGKYTDTTYYSRDDFND